MTGLKRLGWIGSVVHIIITAVCFIKINLFVSLKILQLAKPTRNTVELWWFNTLYSSTVPIMWHGQWQDDNENILCEQTTCYSKPFNKHCKVEGRWVSPLRPITFRVTDIFKSPPLTNLQLVLALRTDMVLAHLYFSGPVIFQVASTVYKRTSVPRLQSILSAFSQNHSHNSLSVGQEWSRFIWIVTRAYIEFLPCDIQ